MFVTMNRFTIATEFREAFEDRFRQRESFLGEVPGFIRNTVLRPVEGSSNQHIVMTLWTSREAFENWTKSDSFRKAHANAGKTPTEWYAAPTKLDAFESVCDHSA